MKTWGLPISHASSGAHALAACLLVVAGQAGAAVHYVNAANDNPSPPYTNWATAAQVIQNAIDIALPGDHILVTNGVYAKGGRVVNGSALTNRVAITGAFTVESVNGPAVTVIQGWQVPGTTNGASAVRCAYLTNGAVLVGFTLTNGATRIALDDGGRGGGLWSENEYCCSFVSNCVIIGNSSYNFGGGAWGATLSNCILSDNSAGIGGGCSDSKLLNCTISGNRAAQYYGGVGQSILDNCILYFNRSGRSGIDNWDTDSTLRYCCTTPVPRGIGSINNITNDPGFVDLLGGNFRLQYNSPCINSGLNAVASSETDLDGLPRISGDTIDIGAYEYQGPPTLVSIAWLQQYGLPIDGSGDTSDTDGDGLTNWAEWKAGTNPTNALSTLRLLLPSQVGSNLEVSWESVPGRRYFLEWSGNLGATPRFQVLASNLTAGASISTFTHTNAAVGGPWFYRLGVQ